MLLADDEFMLESILIMVVEILLNISGYFLKNKFDHEWMDALKNTSMTTQSKFSTTFAVVVESCDNEFFFFFKITKVVKKLVVIEQLLFLK